jgi:6-phosphogluconolactonase
VMPTDERMVSELNPRSNARLIRETLLRGPAAAAHFVDFYEPILGMRTSRVEAALPLDVLVLGMGGDMHTASLFPGAPELAAALADDAPPLMEIHPPSQPEARLTLTAPVIQGASVIHILITGEDKLAALETALADGPVTEAPVRVALTAPCPVTVHYAV